MQRHRRRCGWSWAERGPISIAPLLAREPHAVACGADRLVLPRTIRLNRA